MSQNDDDRDALASAPLAAETAGAAEGADDLAVLVPDVTIEIGGEKITVRELRFGEQIRHAGALATVVAALKAGLRDGDGPALLIDALTACEKDLFALLGAATGQAAEWIEALAGADGEALLLAFWEANKPFFTRRLIVYPAVATLAVARAGGASSPPSSGTATGEAN